MVQNWIFGPFPKGSNLKSACFLYTALLEDKCFQQFQQS